MATYYVDPENGLEANDGLTTGTPWKLIPGQTGSHTVVNNDTINIKNGTYSTGGTISVPNNGLTYQGYGVASNVLYINLPGDDVSQLVNTKVVRTAGSHEGMWVLDMRGQSGVGISIPIARSNTTMTDFHVLCNSTNSTGIVCGSSSATNANPGAVFRRFMISGAGGTGFSAYKHNITMEYGRLSRASQDLCVFGSTALNLYRAGSIDVVRYMHYEFPNTTWDDLPLPAVGDCVQLFHTTGRNEANYTFSDIFFHKRDSSKQTMLLMDGTGGISIKRFHVASDRPDSQCGFMLNDIRGSILIERGYWAGNNTQQCIRVRSSSNLPAQILATGASITIRHVVRNGSNLIPFFDTGDDHVTELDGTVLIENCTMMGNQDQFAGTVGTINVAGNPTTFGANFNITARNCAFTQSGVHINMASGGANNSKWVFTKNYYSPIATFKIGATVYNTLTEFNAAHSFSTSSLNSGETYLNVNGVPTNTNSVLKAAGTHLGYRRDLCGVQMYNPPSIGACEYRRDRGT